MHREDGGTSFAAVRASRHGKLTQIRSWKMNQQTLKGQWNVIKGRVREKWGQLTDDEVTRTEGNMEQLIGLIQRKTGETRSKIENSLDEISQQGSAFVNRLTESAQELAADAAQGVQQAAQHVYEAAQSGFEETQQLIRRRPMEALSVCFGIGLLSGVIVGLIIRSRG
jgi:uncharacterized protein YjbJ (UPF0337 family)